jgi:hypothetical protein
MNQPDNVDASTDYKQLAITNWILWAIVLGFAMCHAHQVVDLVLIAIAALEGYANFTAVYRCWGLRKKKEKRVMRSENVKFTDPQVLP